MEYEVMQVKLATLRRLYREKKIDEKTYTDSVMSILGFDKNE